MKRRYQVFVSSVFKELEIERSLVMKSLLTNRYLPAGMEQFPASDEPQFEFIKRIIDESDFFIVILGHKYGSVNPETNLSYTEMEYRYAMEQRKPILRFLVENFDTAPRSLGESDHEQYSKLCSFRKLLMKDRLCKLYKSAEELATEVITSLSYMVQQHPNLGWIPVSQIPAVPSVEPVDYDSVKVQLEKTVVYKMLNLQSIEDHQEVIYKKYIRRLDQTIGITSEYTSLKINRFEQPIRSFKSRDRTKGSAVEVDSLYPFRLGLDDGDNNATMIEPVINGPSDIFVISNHFYNGFKKGDFDLGIKADKDTRIVRLLIDFSSIPNFEKMLKNTPRLFYKRLVEESNEDSGDQFVNEEITNFKTPGPGIFLAEMRNMKKEEGFRFEFSVDIATMSNAV